MAVTRGVNPIQQHDHSQYLFLPEVPAGFPMDIAKDLQFQRFHRSEQEYWKAYAQHRLQILFMTFKQSALYQPHPKEGQPIETGAPHYRYEQALETVAMQSVPQRGVRNRLHVFSHDITRKTPLMSVETNKLRYYSGSTQEMDQSFYQGVLQYPRFSLKLGREYASGDEHIRSEIPLDFHPLKLPVAVITMGLPIEQLFPSEEINEYLVAPHVALPDRLTIGEFKELAQSPIDTTTPIKQFFEQFVDGIYLIKVKKEQSTS